MYLYELKKIKKIAILGYGKEGKSTLRFLLRLGIHESEITVLDKNSVEIGSANINIITGGNYLDTLGDYNLIFKSPGISPYNPKILPYRDKLTSQTEIFFDNYEGRTVGITATKGKSTVSSLLFETLKNANYNVKIVGNIGNPVFDEIDLLDPQDYNYVIYELSSYMLETCEPHCSIAVLGNIYTCHLDWHNDNFSVYEQAKLNILKNSQYKSISQEFSHYGQNIVNVYNFGLESNYHYDENYFYMGDKQLFSSENILLLGEHNKKNISCVVSVLDIITQGYNHGSQWIFSKLVNALELTLQEFTGLPHRMEKVAEYNQITFIDDGISTTPESTIEAIKTFGKKINTLFLGGGDYGFTKDSYTLLKNAIYEYKIENIVLFPDTGLDVFEIQRDSKNNGEEFNCYIEDFKLNLIYATNMQTAVEFAYKNTGSGKICLMSCAAPSYSLWSGYEEKGKEFLKYINENKKENI